MPGIELMPMARDMDRTFYRPLFDTFIRSCFFFALLLATFVFAPPVHAQEPAESDQPEPSTSSVSPPSVSPQMGEGEERKEKEETKIFGDDGDNGDGGDEKQDDEESGHKGFLSRLSVGIGYGFYDGSGQADPIEGVEVIKDPSHGGPALNVSLDWGLGIIENLALHVGLIFETLLTANEAANISTFYLLGAGGGASYYFMPFDLYLTGQIRWVGALFFLPDAPCGFLGFGKLKGFDGIELSLSFGKEWFPEDSETGFGIGLQINYAYLADMPTIHYFSIMLAPTLTRF